MNLRVGCVGAGYFSQFHINSWQRIPDAKLVAVCDRDLDKARATGLPAYAEMRAML
ncbi:MAG: Gfo/Idh/MocA family oxidoreductase, partial [Pseudomonadota bacterium]